MVEIMGVELSERKWKKAIKSDKGPFERSKIIPDENIVGPSLVEDKTVGVTGDVSGHAGGMEVFQALQHCTPQQRDIHKELEGKDFEKSVEFAFVISNLDKVWKIKIKALQDLLSYINEEEGEISNEEKMVAKAKGMKEAIIDPGLKKYFPGDFNLLKKDIDDMERFMDDLDAVKKHLESVKEKVEAHLARIKEQFPFLFE